ncbi:hypothetical protein MKI84_11570 [Ancylobacter sp. A5.8]|uniref:hypothetical protein n=1 Tax=Ancylobacter gelatini TaxID=2919920 RepID=UPI001F4D7F44|nr:hypothetical protein [Ancylobacter gelatini]MCJ8143554.1 hypothetical protein [Ancylobacter gelatini]
MRVADTGAHGHPGSGPVGSGRIRTALAFPLIALLLAGCAGIDGTGGGGNEGPLGAGNSGSQGGFGSTMETTTVAASPRAATTPAAPAATTLPASAISTQVVQSGSDGGGASTGDTSDFTCPGVQVRGGAAAWQVTDPGDGGLRYQATLGQFSRECHYTTPDMTMRVGIQGRVLLGAKGGPGRVSVPIRLALVEEGPVPKPVWTKFYSVPVEIGEGVMQVDFGLVASDVTFPRPSPATLERYVLYVGFDPQGATEKPTRPRPAKPKPAQAAAPRPAQSAPAAARTTPVQSTPVQSAPIEVEPAQAAPAAAPAPVAVQPAPAAPAQNQWIGTPAPSTGGFSQ